MQNKEFLDAVGYDVWGKKRGLSIQAHWDGLEHEHHLGSFQFDDLATGKISVVDFLGFIGYEKWKEKPNLAIKARWDNRNTPYELGVIWFERLNNES